MEGGRGERGVVRGELNGGKEDDGCCRKVMKIRLVEYEKE